MAAWLNLHFLLWKRKEKKTGAEKNKSCKRLEIPLVGHVAKPSRSSASLAWISSSVSSYWDSHPNISFKVISFNITCVLFFRLATNIETDIKLKSTRQNRKKADKLLPYHKLLSSRTYGINAALYVDSRAASVCVVSVELGEVYMGSSALVNVLDIGSVAAQKKVVVLGCDVQLCADQHWASQRPSQVLQ